MPYRPCPAAGIWEGAVATPSCVPCGNVSCGGDAPIGVVVSAISGDVVDVGLGSSSGGADSWAWVLLGVGVAGMCGWGGDKTGWLG